VSDSASLQVRTVFISDIHLGTRGCQAHLVLDFLKNVEAETIYLVGDIIDGWRLKGGWFWPQTHNDVVQKFLRKVRKGTRVIYVPGNHDEFLRDYVGTNFGGVDVVMEATHEMADGKTYLIIHGDKFDMVVRHARWIAHLGDWAYDFAVALNTIVSMVRRRMGLPYWSLAGWGKRKVKKAVNFITAFEDAVINDARRAKVDGVICGHIHYPVMREIDGFHYVNTGDWVDSCSALVEHMDGKLELLEWRQIAELTEAKQFQGNVKAAA
jgi:UDP-2,3-diacylglucosamine pyrophosphatase LpxH